MDDSWTAANLPRNFMQPDSVHETIKAQSRTFLVYKKDRNPNMIVERTHVLFEDGWVVFCNLSRFGELTKRMNVVALPSYPTMLCVEEITEPKATPQEKAAERMAGDEGPIEPPPSLGPVIRSPANPYENPHQGPYGDQV